MKLSDEYDCECLVECRPIHVDSGREGEDKLGDEGRDVVVSLAAHH